MHKGSSVASHQPSRTTAAIHVQNLRSAARRGGSKSFHGNQLLARAPLKSLNGKVFCQVRGRYPSAYSRNA
ncbi:hypothetical protein XarbCFBP7408_14540 [Xanthomonas arboricola pv. guizotiae]|uniref:Uncharacterized protein n=1 Tax=Xanthomonas arboricola pv. guizotiae TaxID=487867 RepID=A0A2S6ZU73_9XANT|nr:hypothetical protein XarbCFBP7409_16590 [Xanthomonas arboricola pv. guizotiae]PPU22652.1 hypothetical protein XarbCFBP7408_14540 [Xanthomonas arboricola pv. guizotiae]